MHRYWGDVIAVSDGLGSKPFSDFGSHAACLAVQWAIRSSYRSGIERSCITNLILENWLLRISPLNPRDCAATCLFAFRIFSGEIYIGMLGDGSVSLVKSDGSTVSISDDKQQGFSNITSALSPSVSEKDWQWCTFSEEESRAIVLCTDGVADDLSDIDGFVTGLIKVHSELASISAARHSREMLDNWPTPKHSDDKTITCLLREEVSSEDE